MTRPKLDRRKKTFSLNPEIAKAIEDNAFDENITESDFIQLLVREYLRRKENFYVD